MAFNLFEAPEYYQGLLGEDETKKLQNRALTTGLVNAAIGYLAQPKNQGYGSALPYLGRALAGGLQSGQETIRSGLTDYETQQKIAEIKRKQEQQASQQKFLQEYSSMLPEQQRAAVMAYPELGAKLAELSFTPTKKQYEKVGNRLVEVSGATPVVAYTAPEEAPFKIGATRDFTQGSGPSTVRVTQEYQGPDKGWVEISKGSAFSSTPQTVVMTPRQIFQDEQALRKEYSAIPEVKLFGEVQNSYDTIKTALGNPSPAGDLAGATKFMKLLDPGSVVRESELGLAMAATGLVDRGQNYVNMLKSGQKLNPAQRQDFMDVADKLYQAAQSRKSSYDQQYGSIAEQNQLSPTNVVKGFKKQGEWSIKEKK